MIAQSDRSNSHYARFVELLRSLHRLIAEGKGDSPVADAVRDEMDALAPFLAEGELHRVEGLSGDLYSLTGDEMYSPEDRSNPVSESAIKAAWQAEDYDRVLALLHRPAPFLTADQIAFMRAHCWAQLGDLETALLFYQRASDLAPRDEQYTVMLMLTYLGLGGLSDARGCAARLADDSAVTMPIILLRAAGVLYASLGELPAAGSKSAQTRIVELITRAFEMDRQLPPESRLNDSDRAQYLAVAAACYLEMGKPQDAVEAFEKALRLDPHNELAGTAKIALSHGLQAFGGSAAQDRAMQSQVEARERQDRDRVFRDPFVATGV